MQFYFWWSLIIRIWWFLVCLFQWQICGNKGNKRQHWRLQMGKETVYSKCKSHPRTNSTFNWIFLSPSINSPLRDTTFQIHHRFHEGRGWASFCKLMKSRNLHLHRKSTLIPFVLGNTCQRVLTETSLFQGFLLAEKES